MATIKLTKKEEIQKTKLEKEYKKQVINFTGLKLKEEDDGYGATNYKLNNKVLFNSNNYEIANIFNNNFQKVFEINYIKGLGFFKTYYIATNFKNEQELLQHVTNKIAELKNEQETNMQNNKITEQQFNYINDIEKNWDVE